MTGFLEGSRIGRRIGTSEVGALDDLRSPSVPGLLVEDLGREEVPRGGL